MGVVHLCPLGINPGAVTAALAYLKHNQSVFDYYRDKGDIIESVVLFAPYDVAEGDITIQECVFNEYAGLRARRSWRRQERPNIVSIVKVFIEQEIAPIMPSKGKVYLWSLNPNNFHDCFDVLADVTLALGRPDATGKHLWANLTGGTNILNAALFEVGSLSGLIARLYYTFVPDESDRKYLQPPSSDRGRFDWKWVPLTKTSFDENYYKLLSILADLEDWCPDEHLLSFLKQDHEVGEYFADLPLSRLRTQFLNRMDRHELARDGQCVRLRDEGHRVLERVRSPRFQALVHRGQDLNPQERDRLKSILKEHELWSK